MAALALGCVGAPVRALHPAPPPSLETLATEYRAFLDNGRTPNAAVDFLRGRANGWKRVDPFATTAYKAKAGDRLVFVNRGRTAIFVIVGKQPLVSAGARIIGAHIDTPALRVTATTLTASNQTTLTLHRYGGARTHHWGHRPVALVGTVVRKGGKAVRVSLGLGDGFSLYVKRSGKRMQLLTSSTPTSGPGAVTLLGTLEKRFGITAEDLRASELYVVPTEVAREVGVDRSLIGAHGQDDRVNCYVSWRALMDVKGVPERTAMAWLVDREEVGSTGPVGARSRFLELVYAYLLRGQGQRVTESVMHRAFAATEMISADTPAGINPNFPEVHEPMNAPVLGKGPALFPFTGRGGKRGGNAAHASMIASIIRTFDNAKAALQHGQLGRVDEGGGGTIAKFVAERGANVVDVGVAVLSMHSPMELSSKQDLWAAYSGFRAWLGGSK